MSEILSTKVEVRKSLQNLYRTVTSRVRTSASLADEAESLPAHTECEYHSLAA